MNIENLVAVDCMVNFKLNGRFKIEYFRFENKLQERITIKLEKLLKENIEYRGWITQDYEYYKNRIRSEIRIYYQIEKCTFYIKKN